MDNYGSQQDSIFNFGIDETAKTYLLEAARWGRFLSIVGFVLIAFMALGFVALIANASDVAESLGAAYGIGFGLGTLLFWGAMVALVFYLNWSLYKFSANVRSSLPSMNQELFNEGLRYLKNMFKVWGICMIVVLSIYGIIILFAVFASLAGMS
jgi:predicted PurR-regulated permease PerM